MSAHQQSCASHHLIRRLLSHPEFMSAKRVGIYLASDGEISPNLLLSNKHKHLKNKLFFVPIVQKNKNK